MELEKIHKEKDICNIAKIHVEKSLTRCNIVQLEKFYSELSQPVASDIDFEYLLIFMMITLMKMMTMMRVVK